MPLYFRKLLFWGICLLDFATTSPAQEGRYISTATWTSEDARQIILLVNQGIAYMHNHPDSALVLFKEAELQSKAKGFNDGIGYALSFMGLLRTNSGDYNRGFAAYQEALPYCLNAKYINSALPNLYINMGVSYISKGDYETGNLYYHRALNYLLQKLPNDKSILQVYSNLSAAQGQLGNYRQALHYAQQAERLSNKKRELPISTLINMGEAYIRLNQPDSALYCFEKGLVRAKVGKNVKMLQAILTSMGDMMAKEGKYQKAISYYEEALAFNTSNLISNINIMLGYSLGGFYLKTKEYKKAEKVLIEALNLAEQSHLIEGKHEGHQYLADVYEATGRYREALQQRHIYEYLKDSLTGIEKIKAVGEIEAKYKAEQKDRIITLKQLQISEQQRKMERKNILIAASIIFSILITLTVILVYRYKRRMDERRKEIIKLKAGMDGEEKERRRLARELHDGLGGILTSARLNLNSVKKKNTINQEELEDLSLLLQELNNEIHHTAHNLTPDILEEKDLWQALLAHCEHINRSGKLQIDMQSHGDLSGLDHQITLPLYRIAQELIQNAIKHSNASVLSVQVRYDTESAKVFLSVEDNGNGYQATANTPGLGLKNIRERVRILNGFMDVESAPGVGTTVFIEIDVPKNNG